MGRSNCSRSSPKSNRSGDAVRAGLVAILGRRSMTSETFKSGGANYRITVYPGPADRKRHPMILFAHGNFGLGPIYGDQIRGFAESLAKLGYVTAVPHFYTDEGLHPDDRDPAPYVEKLSY